MKPLVTFVLLAFALAGTATPASAQDRPGRPYRGLFGGGAGDWEQAMTANASFGAGYDDNLRAEAAGSGIAGAISPRTNQGGVLGSFSGSLSHSLNRETVSMSAGASMSGRYYPKLDTSTLYAHHGSAEAGWRLSSRTRLNAGAFAYYRPFSLTGFFPTADGISDIDAPVTMDVPDAPIESLDLDQAGSSRSYFGYGSGIGIGRQLTKRASLNLRYTFRAAQTANYGGGFHQHGASGSIQFQVAKGLGWHLGYGIRRNYHGSDEPIENHNIRVGIDYNRALSFSRRTTLSFGTGTAATSSATNKTTYRATGAASLAHEIGRSWGASLNYSRGVRFVDTLADPIFADSVSASVSGLITRRFQFTSTTHASFGSMTGRRYDVYYQSFALQTGLNRHVSVSTSYSYFIYDFAEGIQLPPGISHEVGRNSARVQVSLWAPVFQRARRN